MVVLSEIENMPSFYRTYFTFLIECFVHKSLVFVPRVTFLFFKALNNFTDLQQTKYVFHYLHSCFVYLAVFCLLALNH